MKKGLLVSLAACSLLVIAACGNDTNETAEAPAEQTTTQQPVEQPAEAKIPEVEVAAEPEAAVETMAAAESEESGISLEAYEVTNADQQLANDYIEQLNPVMSVIDPTMSNLLEAMIAWNHGELDDDTLREYLISANAAFTLLEYDLKRVAVPHTEYAPLYDALSELRDVILRMAEDGGRGVDLFIEALDTQNEAMVEEAYDAFAPFEEYGERAEELYAELQTMTGIE